MVTFSFNIPERKFPELHEKVSKLAEDPEINFSGLVVKALTKYLD